MKKRMMVVVSAVSLAVVSAWAGMSSQNKYSVKVPDGLAFSEFRGYEGWSVIAVSESGGRIAVILGNPEIIRAFRDGVPSNGKPFPDGSKMAKIHWNQKQANTEPGQPIVPGTQVNADFMVKDSKRFADGGGWGWAAFDYEATSGAFTPGTTADKPPQGHDAKCGLACHTIVKNRDYVFTRYATR
jgi:hypothetical protein